jgi:flagellar FliJ protein
LSLAAYRNFQLFMEKVDQAIAGQQQIVSSAEQRTGLAQDNWQQKKRESVGYTTLIQRAVIKREKTEHKRDQKSSDEFAARAMLMRARED